MLQLMTFKNVAQKKKLYFMSGKFQNPSGKSKICVMRQGGEQKK